MKKKGRRRRKEGEEEDEKGDEPPLDVFARFATGHGPLLGGGRARTCKQALAKERPSAG